MSLNAASLVDLKAELARKQEQFRQERLNPEQRDIRLQEEKIKRSAGWLKTNKGVHTRNQRDLLQEAEDTKSLERAEVALKAKAALYERMRQGTLTEEEQQRYLVDFERKMIERMENMVREVEEEDKRRRAQGQAAGGAGSAPAGAEADDDDYHSRHRYQDGEAPRPIMRPVFVDRTDPEELVEYVDEFGRKRHVKRRDLPSVQALDSQPPPQTRSDRPQWQRPMSDNDHSSGQPQPRAGHSFVEPASAAREMPTLLSGDMRREAERQAWQKEEEASLANHGPTHYETVRHSEIRQLGTGYFQFSTDEDERAKQMSALEDLRQETEAGRDRRERLLERRQAANEARLAKIRRRKAAAGLPTGEEPLSKRAPVENKEGDDAGNVDEVSIDAFLRDVWGSDETGPS